MLKEKQEGNDGGGWRGKKDDKQGLWGFHPAFLLILIIYGLLKSHQNMMIKKKKKKPTKLDVLGSLLQEVLRVLRCKNNEPQGKSLKQATVFESQIIFYLWQLFWGWSVKYPFEIYLLGFQNNDTSTVHLSWSRDAAPGDKVCVCPWK